MPVWFTLSQHKYCAGWQILHFGSEKQKLKYLPGICNGDMVAAQAITEQAPVQMLFHANESINDGENWV